jgi:hypothetical protein
VAGMAAIASPAGATAPPPIDVSNAVATCNTVTGTLKFSTPLNLSNPSTGNETVTVKTKLAGCTSPTVTSAVQAIDPLGATIFGGSASGVLVSTGGTNCLGLAGAGTASGVLTTKWTPPKKSKFIPAETVAGHLGTYSQSTVSGDQGNQFTIDSSQLPYAGTYGQFTVGQDYGTTPISDTGANDAFKGTGAHNGHNSWLNVIGNLDVVNELNLCTGAGIKSLTVGIGGAEIG